MHIHKESMSFVKKYQEFKADVHTQIKSIKSNIKVYCEQNRDDILKIHPHYMNNHNVNVVIDNFYDEYFYHHNHEGGNISGQTHHSKKEDCEMTEANDSYVYVVCEACDVSIEFPCTFTHIQEKSKRVFDDRLLEIEMTSLLEDAFKKNMGIT